MSICTISVGEFGFCYAQNFIIVAITYIILLIKCWQDLFHATFFTEYFYWVPHFWHQRGPYHWFVFDNYFWNHKTENIASFLCHYYLNYMTFVENIFYFYQSGSYSQWSILPHIPLARHVCQLIPPLQKSQFFENYGCFVCFSWQKREQKGWSLIQT